MCPEDICPPESPYGADERLDPGAKEILKELYRRSL